jgi:hypothetical protein
MRQIRIELYVGFADAPRAYDNLKLRLNEFEIDEVTDRLNAWMHASITELDELRVNDDADDD